MRVTFTILGEAASKANRRRIKKIDGVMRSVKSPEAVRFALNAALQIPVAARVMYAGPVRLTCRMFYRTERPDLDESLVMDALQAHYSVGGQRNGELVRRGVIINDRQVREKHVYHGVDARNPRVEVEVESL